MLIARRTGPIEARAVTPKMTIVAAPMAAGSAALASAGVHEAPQRRSKAEESEIAFRNTHHLQALRFAAVEDGSLRALGGYHLA
jgi:hypothetical protein